MLLACGGVESAQLTKIIVLFDAGRPIFAEIVGDTILGRFTLNLNILCKVILLA